MDLTDLLDLLKVEDPAAAEALERAAGFETDEWVLVYRWDVENAVGDSERAVFLRGGDLERARHTAGHDHKPGDGKPGFVTYGNGEGGWETRWELVGQGDTVPLVHIRNYRGPFPSTVELGEDFRLCFDLYEDPATREYVTVDELVDRVVAARWIGNNCLSRSRFLRRCQAARQLHLCLQFWVDRHGGVELKHLDDINVDIDQDTWRSRTTAPTACGSRLSGTSPASLASGSCRPLRSSGPACGRTTNRRSTRSSSSGSTRKVGRSRIRATPISSRTTSGRTPDAPHYLTPVYFRPEVLGKYVVALDELTAALDSFSTSRTSGRPEEGPQRRPGCAPVVPTARRP